MFAEIIVIAIMLFLVVSIFANSCYSNEFFMGKDYATVMKAVSCIVIIMVHIPDNYSTKVQNIVGSFAFICVTLFFFFSAYGLVLSTENPGYLRHFWRNRLSSLFIPMLFVNLVRIGARFILSGEHMTLKALVHLDGFVVMLIICYAIFFVIYSYISGRKRLIVLGIGVVLFSVFCYSLKNVLTVTTWHVPCLGFLYGAIFAEHRKEIVPFFQNGNAMTAKLILAFIASIAFGVGYLYLKSVPILGDYVVRVLLAVSVMTFIGLLTGRISIGNKYLLKIGIISYEIYLLHGIVIWSLEILIPSIGPGCFILCTVILSIMMAQMIHKISKKVIQLIRV